MMFYKHNIYYDLQASIEFSHLFITY